MQGRHMDGLATRMEAKQRPGNFHSRARALHTAHPTYRHRHRLPGSGSSPGSATGSTPSTFGTLITAAE